MVWRFPLLPVNGKYWEKFTGRPLLGSRDKIRDGNAPKNNSNNWEQTSLSPRLTKELRRLDPVNFTDKFSRPPRRYRWWYLTLSKDGGFHWRISGESFFHIGAHLTRNKLERTFLWNLGWRLCEYHLLVNMLRCLMLSALKWLRVPSLRRWKNDILL